MRKISHRGSKGFGFLGRRATIKAKHANQSRINYRGRLYTIEDAYPTKEGAYVRVTHLRTLKGRLYPNNYTKAIVVDLGVDAGRLRYAVFTAKGRRIRG